MSSALSTLFNKGIWLFKSRGCKDWKAELDVEPCLLSDVGDVSIRSWWILLVEQDYGLTSRKCSLPWKRWCCRCQLSGGRERPSERKTDLAMWKWTLKPWKRSDSLEGLISVYQSATNWHWAQASLWAEIIPKRYPKETHLLCATHRVRHWM